MGVSARFLLGVLLVAVFVTIMASAAGWWLAPRRRAARAIARRLGHRADADAISPQTGRGAGVSAATGGFVVVRFLGDSGALYALQALRGVELAIDGDVKARAFRGEGRRALDRIDIAEGGRVTLRIAVDDPRDPIFELDLWRPQDIVRPGWEPQAALREARALYDRIEAVVLRPVEGIGIGP